MSGRFAPSPTGRLHVGNLRTALAAWLLARSGGMGFLVRIEDLDRATSSIEHERQQLADLDALGIDWDGPVVRQSERFDRYHEAIARLSGAGLTYECFCTRREIREAASAPHRGRPEGAYPGTCRALTDAERRRRRAERAPALRLRADGETVSVDDVIAGRHVGVPDDVVLRRNDGVPAYNLAVVVDDAAQGVTHVARGDDLLESTPRQVLLQRLLGLPAITYAHVPLVVGADGERLAKRHGAVTLADLEARGVDAAMLRAVLAASLGVDEAAAAASPTDLLYAFDLGRLRAAAAAGPVRFDDLERAWS